MARKRKKPYISGHCMFAHGQYPCKGEVQNGALVKPRTTLCSCTCHGDYEARLVAAGQVLVLEEEAGEDDDELLDVA